MNKNTFLEDTTFKERRLKFQKANSPEDIKQLYIQTISDFPERYKYSISDYAEQGVADVIERSKFLKEQILAGRVIDIGCSDGYFVFELSKICEKIIGIDMLEKRVQRANEFSKENNISNASFIVAFAESLPFDDDYFDTSILSHMLEHVHNPEIVIKEAVRVTKNYGRLIAIVPHDIGRDPTHLRCIPSEELYNILKGYGTVSAKYVVGTKGIGYICTIKKKII